MTEIVILVFGFLWLLAAPHLTGLLLKAFVNLIEVPVVGPVIISQVKKQNKMVQV